MIFVAIGYKQHLVDGIVPRVFKKLERKFPLKVYYCNGQQIESTIKKLKYHKGEEIIALDVGYTKDKTFMTSVKGGVRPAHAITGNNKRIGTIGYIINISNVCSKEELNLENNRIRKRVKKIERKLYRKLYEVLSNLQEGAVLF